MSLPRSERRPRRSVDRIRLLHYADDVAASAFSVGRATTLVLCAEVDAVTTAGHNTNSSWLLDRKAAWRAQLRASRRALPAEIRTARAEALSAAALRLAAACTGPVCAFVPVGTEPWSPHGLELLRDAGREVFLPVIPIRPGPLQWASYEGPGTLTRSTFGVREPTGPRLGVDAISRADLILLPALAVDRRGVRLGQGGGYYDQSLPLVAQHVPLVVVINDEELVDELPAEPHDRRVTGALLPSGFVPLRETCEYGSCDVA
jgi:5-formyltetrahydrofolate cyclo-ligase